MLFCFKFPYSHWMCERLLLCMLYAVCCMSVFCLNSFILYHLMCSSLCISISNGKFVATWEQLEWQNEIKIKIKDKMQNSIREIDQSELVRPDSVGLCVKNWLTKIRMCARQCWRVSVHEIEPLVCIFNDYSVLRFRFVVIRRWILVSTVCINRKFIPSILTYISIPTLEHWRGI